MSSENNQPNILTELSRISSSKGSVWPASTVVSNIDLAAELSKIVRPKQQAMFRPSEPDSSSSAINTGIDMISKTIMARIEDNENIFRLFPDIELAAQIIISSILSPKDMVKSELIYRLKETKFPPEMVTKLIAIVKSTMEQQYKLHDDLPQILRKALFQTGSCVKAILPESAVDQLINSGRKITTENIRTPDIFEAPLSPDGEYKLRNIGILGDPRATAEKKNVFSFEMALSASAAPNYDSRFHFPTESISTDADVDVAALVRLMEAQVQVSDNYQFLKMPEVIAAANRQTVNSLVGSKLGSAATRFATENYQMFEEKKKAMTTRDLETMIYKSSSGVYAPFVNVPGKDSLHRRSVGRPLVLDIPSESAVPVFVPGNVSQHIGYFFLIDIDGNPITVDSTGYDSGQGLGSMLQSSQTGGSLSSLLTEKARRNLANDGMVPMIEKMTDLYADLIEKDLLQRLLKGAYGKKMQVGRNNEIYRIMLARTLQSQMTRMIYVPAEYVTYFAFNFHRNGVGRSYLDDLSNITSMRALVLFSKVMAKVKSCIETTTVNVTLDPRDPDPQKTLEQSKHLVARARQQFFPHGLNRVVDLTNWIQQAGIQMTFTGHPRLPETKFAFESKSTTHPEPDDTLDEMFRHQTYMHFGLSPETVDSAAKADFATTIENQSILFARRIFMLSNTFSANLTDFSRKTISNDEIALAEMTEAMKSFQGELEKGLSDEEKALFSKDPNGFNSYILQDFLSLLEVDMPKPDSTKNANQKLAIDSYSELVDKALMFIIDETTLPESLAGRSSQYVKAVRDAWKASLMRDWMASNNYTPEAFRITERGEEGKAACNLLEAQTTYNENLMANIVGYLDKMTGAMVAADKDLNKIAGNLGGEADGSGVGGDGSGGEFGGGGSGEETPGGADGLNGNGFDMPPEGGDGDTKTPEADTSNAFETM